MPRFPSDYGFTPSCEQQPATPASFRGATVRLRYPEERLVSGERLMIWAEDAFVNGEVARRPRDLEDALWLLEDGGMVTRDERRGPAIHWRTKPDLPLHAENGDDE